MTMLTKLLAFPDYATDENGFLYKLDRHGVASAIRPVTHGRYSRDVPVSFYIQIGKRKYRFLQSDLQKQQGCAIAKILIKSRPEPLQTDPTCL